MALPRPHEDVVAERVGEDLVLVHLGTNEIFALNPTGARFLGLLVDGESNETLEERITQYDLGCDELCLDRCHARRTACGTV